MIREILQPILNVLFKTKRRLAWESALVVLIVIVLARLAGGLGGGHPTPAAASPQAGRAAAAAPATTTAPAPTTTAPTTTAPASSAPAAAAATPTASQPATVPSAAPVAAANATAAAQAFAALWVQHDAQWAAHLHPYVTASLWSQISAEGPAYAYNQASKITGSPSITSSTPTTVSFSLPSNAGPVLVTVQLTAGHWLTSSVMLQLTGD